MSYPDGPFKQLYGWNTINTNIWLPSISELVGAAGAQHATRGTYLSAMQGMNTSSDYWVDSKGGTQFSYFAQYNASGGGTAIWNACKQENTWLRSPSSANANSGWFVNLSISRFDWTTTNATQAVHPAVCANIVKRKTKRFPSPPGDAWLRFFYFSLGFHF